MELYLSRRRSSDSDGEQWIRFPEKSENEFELGRSQESHVRLLSAHVSRNHATIKRTDDDKFVIKDKKSMHGIHVNDSRIKAETWKLLNEGDVVEIGRPDEDAKGLEVDDRFIYVVKTARFLELDRKKPGPKSHVAASCRKQIKAVPKKKIVPKLSNMKVKPNPFPKEGGKIDCCNTAEDKLFESNNNNEAPVRRRSDPEMEQENKRLKLELEKREEIDARNKRLEEEQKKMAAQLEENYKNKLVEKEEELEMRLQLEKDIAVEQCKANIEKKARPSSTLDTVVNTMESELQCSICSELFIVSTTLNCAHTFCEFCISEWRKVKNMCPVCRSPIETTTRSLVLDNYIDKVMESLSGERKEIRKKLIEQRKKVIETQKKSSNSATRGRRRHNNRGRGGSYQDRNIGVTSRGRGRANNVIPSGIRTRSSAIVISDDSSDSLLDDSTSDESVMEREIGFLESSESSDDDGWYRGWNRNLYY